MAMNINVYLQEKLLAQIDALAHRDRVSRSALIRAALESWMQRETAPVWPAAVSDWAGDPDFPPFESSRAVAPPGRLDDPFATDRDPR